ncbi:radical SAM protein [Ktedonospora formicarum]|uniref:Uncharacterized protein n=1 Tax=Ktedonospora formicarum TaxID=2778364 RepID=A0A8J3I1V2_9CHLR|nr:radical SAM protein [Ktedonospora formicarum]GHO45173.1 hypothetical protein KSX_33360 [Ktedonospora formicarum]
MEDKMNYSVLVWYRGCLHNCEGHQNTNPEKQYTRTRIDRLLADAKNEYGAVKAELKLDGTKLRWWSWSELDGKTQGENLPRRKK